MLRPALAFLAAALAAGVAGCGSGSTDPLASDSAPMIINAAEANTIAAQSVTVSGGPTAAKAVNLTIVHGVGCTGTITQGTVKSTLTWIGKTVYAHSATMPADEWMKGTSSDSDLQGLLGLCQPSVFLASLSASAFTSASRSSTVYDGQPAVDLSLPGSGQGGKGGSVVVTDTATPVLLSISEAGGGSFTFSGYGATATIAPPAAG